MLATLLGAGTASAHSAVIASTPDNGARSRPRPSGSASSFNEALQEKFASLTVVGPDGKPVVQGQPDDPG